jgi:hypothetical protein
MNPHPFVDREMFATLLPSAAGFTLSMEMADITLRVLILAATFVYVFFRARRAWRNRNRDNDPD